MKHYNLTVSEAAIGHLRALEGSLQENSATLKEAVYLLQEAFLMNQKGLGPHSKSILTLLEDMEGFAQQTQYGLDRLALKVRTSAMLRQSVLGASPYGPVQEESLDIARFRGQLYEGYCRKLRKPKTFDAAGNPRGHWDRSVFVPDPGYVPTRHNPRKLTFAQIRRELAQNYGICFTGIPYRDGYADFSGISLAQVDWHSVAQARIQQDPGLILGGEPDYGKIFSDRGKNAACADALAAQQAIRIPGLPDGYTGPQLEKWRSDNGFSWEESLHNGYLLVPSVIHGNIAHTGLVGIMTSGSTYTSRFTGKVQSRAGVEGRLKLSVDNIGKVIYKGKGLKLHRNDSY